MRVSIESAAFLSVLAQACATSCPAGPFQLHNFSYNASATSDAYFIVVCDLATTSRLDPLMMPGTCNSHMHSVFGSNRFGSTVSLADVTLAPGELANTTCNIPADGSMYWAPSLYFKNSTTNKYSLVPVYNKAYYFNRGATMPMQHMPVGLRMIRGNPYRSTPLVWPSAIKNDTVNIFWMDSNETGGFPPGSTVVIGKREPCSQTAGMARTCRRRVLDSTHTWHSAANPTGHARPRTRCACRSFSWK